jgi:protein disulfide-isomerase A1
VQNISDLLDVDRITFIAYLNEKDDLTRSRFTRVAKAYHDQFVFGISTDKKMAEQESIGQYPAVVAYKTDVGDREVLYGKDTGGIKQSQIETFVVEAGAPLVGELTRQSEMVYMSVSPSLRCQVLLF